MAICSMCAVEHSRYRDAAHTIFASYCLSCHALYMRLNRPVFSELPAEAKRRSIARSYAHVYLKRGKLTKGPCMACGNENSQIHHEDYSKPLVVTWLCRPCHLSLHRAVGAVLHAI